MSSRRSRSIPNRFSGRQSSVTAQQTRQWVGNQLRSQTQANVNPYARGPGVMPSKYGSIGGHRPSRPYGFQSMPPPGPPAAFGWRHPFPQARQPYHGVSNQSTGSPYGPIGSQRIQGRQGYVPPRQSYPSSFGWKSPIRDRPGSGNSPYSTGTPTTPVYLQMAPFWKGNSTHTFDSQVAPKDREEDRERYRNRSPDLTPVGKVICRRRLFSERSPDRRY